MIILGTIAALVALAWTIHAYQDDLWDWFAYHFTYDWADKHRSGTRTVSGVKMVPAQDQAGWIESTPSPEDVIWYTAKRDKFVSTADLEADDFGYLTYLGPEYVWYFASEDRLVTMRHKADRNPDSYVYLGVL